MGNVLTVVIFGLVITAVAAVGMRTTARFQLAIAVVEYTVLAVFSAIAFWAVFVGHWPGTVHPTASLAAPSGVGGQGEPVGFHAHRHLLFTGWDATIYINEETQPQAGQPRVGPSIISVAILGHGLRLAVRDVPGVVSPALLAGQHHRRAALPGQALGRRGWAR